MSADEQGYNGWTNWETWNAGLWMDNEEWTYKEIRKRVIGDGSDDVQDLATYLEEYFIPFTGNPDEIDLDEVNWVELAESVLSEFETADES